MQELSMARTPSPPTTSCPPTPDPILTSRCACCGQYAPSGIEHCRACYAAGCGVTPRCGTPERCLCPSCPSTPPSVLDLFCDACADCGCEAHLDPEEDSFEDLGSWWATDERIEALLAAHEEEEATGVSDWLDRFGWSVDDVDALLSEVA